MLIMGANFGKLIVNVHGDQGRAKSLPAVALPADVTIRYEQT